MTGDILEADPAFPSASISENSAAGAGQHNPEKDFLIPRIAPVKPEFTNPSDVSKPETIILKFTEYTGIRLHQGTLLGADVSLDSFYAAMRKEENYGIRRLFSRPEEILDTERAAGQRATGRELADLNLYYLLILPSNSDPVRTARLCDRLNGLEIVEIAYPVPSGGDPENCIDLPPATPLWVSSQDYREAAPVGIDIEAAWNYHPDAHGIGDFWIVDIEQGWNLDHEDLDIDLEDVLNSPYDYEKRDHGTAVIGEIGACDTDTDFGMTGLIPGAQMKMVDWNLESTFAEAFDIAASHLAPGEIYLIEIQTFAGSRIVPMEYYQAEFDAIAAHTARGIVVVEAGANGSEDLDDPFYEGKFDRNIRDSGAILVGAGTPADHSPEWFTNYGSRIDCQGYGSGVYSTGYGYLWSSGGIDQYYTDEFSGTSSASPIVVGAAAATQLLSRGVNGRTLTPFEIRDLISAYGTPQGPPYEKHIGVLPDMAEIIQYLPATLGWRVRLSTTTPLVSPGDTFTVECNLTNLGESQATVQVWSHILLTDGSTYPFKGELAGPRSLTVNAGATKTFSLHHKVPKAAPQGKYIYRGFAGTHDQNVKSMGHVHFETE
jgi:subtilisin family serine protease